MMIISVILGSTRQGRFSERPAQWILQHLRNRKEIEARLLDLRDFPMPFFDQPMPPALPGRPPYENEVVKKWTAEIAASDAFVFVTPEYNHGLTAPLKNAIDYLHSEWLCKPVGFVSYGGAAAGTRAVQMLKQVVLALRMLPAYEAVAISAIGDRLSADADRFEGDHALADAAARMLTELGCLELASRALRPGTT